ncbi:hypothetical protein O181_064901 [Austropuccinia psidii MF-1]|uniref:Uncharacterized protein n=1 Tax=Austropuccinia psidii MF-1 TaxID=1389203 RepID=A0A9Q3EUM9_9BASI|nr:hypothetical protein [Austropuccinia psidii MF-1]
MDLHQQALCVKKKHEQRKGLDELAKAQLHRKPPIRRFLLDLQSVSVKLPPEILSYIILGKMGNNSSLTQAMEMITLNDSLLENHNQVLLRLQEYTNHQAAKTIAKDTPPVSALISSSEHQFKITHFYSNGTQNPKCTTHRKEDCYGDKPHL